MAKTLKGITSIKLGAIAGDGGMAADNDLIEIGTTAKGTVNMTTSDPTFNDVLIEEQTQPFDTVVTDGTTQLVWSTYNLDPDNLVKLFGGTKVDGTSAVNGIPATLGTLAGGTGYTNGSYTNIPVSGGTGTGLLCNITVASGIVTACTIVSGTGSGYTVNDTVAAASGIGGGSGFSVHVASLTNTPATGGVWKAPSSYINIEKSVRITTKNGQVVNIIRALITSKLNLNLTSDKIGQIDITAKVLAPNKANTEPFNFQFAV